MCIALWSLDHSDYALILATNRDEYLSRPTANAHFHSFGTEHNGNFILSGRDLLAGGTWFGINRAGRVALLTNIVEPEGAYKESRGHLATAFLLPNGPDAEHFVDLLEGEGLTDYAGFNLLLLKPKDEHDRDRLVYQASLLTNSGGHGTIMRHVLDPEERCAGGMSNGADNIDGRSWPKVKKGIELLVELLCQSKTRPSEDELVEKLFDLLSWQSEPPPTNAFQMRNSIQIPPFSMPHGLQPTTRPTDRQDIVGTRLSTVLLVRKEGQVLLVERDVWRLNNKGGTIRGDPRDARVFRFTLNDFENKADDLHSRAEQESLSDGKSGA